MLCPLPIACCRHTALRWNRRLTPFHSAPEQHLAPKSTWSTLAINFYFSSKGALPRNLWVILWLMVVHSSNDHVTKKGEVFLKEGKPHTPNTSKSLRLGVWKSLKEKCSSVSVTPYAAGQNIRDHELLPSKASSGTFHLSWSIAK